MLSLASNAVMSKFSASKLAINLDRSISSRFMPYDFSRDVMEFMSTSTLLIMPMISDNLMEDKS